MNIIAAMMSGALAAPVNVTVCGELSINYTDVNSLTVQLDDDYIRSNANQPARGAHVRIEDVTVGGVQTVVLSDANPACGTVTLDNSRQYDFRLRAKATLNGNNTIEVRNNDSANGVWYYQGPTAWTPFFSNSLTLTSGTHAAWNVLAATSFALHRRNAGLSNQTMIFYTQACPGTTGTVSCYNPPNQSLYIHPNHDEFKYVVAHEMGHKIARLKHPAGVNRPNLASPDTCASGIGNLSQKRFAGWAADEGIAWYWAAMAFNNTGHSDCEIYRTGQDFDMDGTPGEAVDNELTPSCEGNPAQESWANLDFIGNECGGILEDRGTYLDYMRAFWDADQGQGLSTADIFNLWHEADPDSWDGNGGSGSNDVQQRLEDGADAIGELSAWNNVDNANGIR